MNSRVHPTYKARSYRAGGDQRHVAFQPDMKVVPIDWLTGEK